ncbi:hypothetical protein [Gorillibacterium sp. sgz500922]|uniref:hypothetical protein n=1 Tax=Gorillibacterium sp. sgz500922 TaxID=3446694 RepID=UPI003F664FCE
MAVAEGMKREPERLEDFLEEWNVAVEPDVLEQKRLRILRKFRFHLSRRRVELRFGLAPQTPEWNAIRLCLRLAVYDATLPPLFQETGECPPSACSGCGESCG